MGLPDASLPSDVVVRTGTRTHAFAVRRLLDVSLLKIPDDLERRLAAGEGIIAVRRSDESTVLGVLLLDGSHIDAVSVRRSHRNQGIGSTLVRTAAARRDGLTADFRPDIRPFYESLGFRITDDGDRLRGRFPADSSGTPSP